MTDSKPVSRTRIPERPPRTAAEVSSYLASFTNYETLRALPPARHALGPHRARRLLESMGLLPTPLPVVQVAGSKGKGSTVLWMEALLLARGARPGCYLSPHLEERNERIRFMGQSVSDERVLQGLSELAKRLPKAKPITDLADMYFNLEEERDRVLEHLKPLVVKKWVEDGRCDLCPS